MRTEQLAQAADLRRDVVLLDHNAGPDEIEQLVLRDQPITTLCQREQQVEGACAQRDIRAINSQQALGRTDLEVAEPQRFVAGGRGHGTHSLDIAEWRWREG